MVRVFIGIAREYCKSVFGERINETWPAMALGYILHLLWNLHSMYAGMGEIAGFIVHAGEIIIVLGISGILGPTFKDTYKLLVGPRWVEPLIKKINKKLDNGKNKRSDREKRA